MRKRYVRILTALFGLTVLAVTARSQGMDQVVVNIPYNFVVSGKTLPAGNYSVNRVSYRETRELVLSNFENRRTVFVLSSEVVDRDGRERPALDFQLVGGQHVLEKIETAEHVFTIPVSPAAPLPIARKNPADVTGLGSSGNK